MFLSGYRLKDGWGRDGQALCSPIQVILEEAYHRTRQDLDGT